MSPVARARRSSRARSAPPAVPDHARDRQRLGTERQRRRAAARSPRTSQRRTRVGSRRPSGAGTAARRGRPGRARPPPPGAASRRRSTSPTDRRREVDPFGDRVPSDHPVRRFEPRQSAERRRDPDGTAAVGGGRDRRHTRGEGGARAPARPTRRPDVPHGFTVVPYTAFAVYPANANSGWFVLPTTIAPASRSLRGTSRRAAGDASANTAEPYVDGRPVTSSMSFTRSGGTGEQDRGRRQRPPGLQSRASLNAARARITSSRVGSRRWIGPRDARRAPSPAGAAYTRPEVRAVHRPFAVSRRRTTLRLRFRPARRVDALRPGTPITPPPGCVPAPQR